MGQEQVGVRAKKRSDIMSGVIGYIANIGGVALLVFSKDLTLLAQFMAVAGVVAGIHLLHRQWGKPVGVRILPAILCLIAGCVIAALAFAASSGSGDGTAFQIRLTPFHGVDLDSSKHEVIATDGPNGDVDLFLTKYGYLTINNGSFYIDIQGPDTETFRRCDEVLKHPHEPQGQILPQTGRRFCFKTSAGQTGWLSVNDSDIYEPIYAVLNVRLW